MPSDKSRNSKSIGHFIYQFPEDEVPFSKLDHWCLNHWILFLKCIFCSVCHIKANKFDHYQNIKPNVFCFMTLYFDLENVTQDNLWVMWTWTSPRPTLMYEQYSAVQFQTKPNFASSNDRRNLDNYLKYKYVLQRILESPAKNSWLVVDIITILDQNLVCRWKIIYKYSFCSILDICDCM